MLLIGNGKVITRDSANPYLENGAVVTDGENIKEVGTLDAMKQKYPEAEFVDAHGGVGGQGDGRRLHGSGGARLALTVGNGADGGHRGVFRGDPYAALLHRHTGKGRKAKGLLGAEGAGIGEGIFLCQSHRGHILVADLFRPVGKGRRADAERKR